MVDRLTTYEYVEGGVPFVVVTDNQDKLQQLARFETFMEQHNLTYEKAEQRLYGVNGHSFELKEKTKPRKLTLEELEKLDSYENVWIKSKLRKTPYGFVMEVYKSPQRRIIDVFKYGGSELSIRDYGDTWCAYTAPPDEERLRST